MKQSAKRPPGLADLTDEQLKFLEELTEKHKAAQRQFSKALGVLWNAQLDLAVSSQDSAFMQKVAAGRLGLWDDCSCC